MQTVLLQVTYSVKLIEGNRLFIVECEIKMILIHLYHDGGHGRKYRRKYSVKLSKMYSLGQKKVIIAYKQFVDFDNNQKTFFPLHQSNVAQKTSTHDCFSQPIMILGEGKLIVQKIQKVQGRSKIFHYSLPFCHLKAC